MVMAGEYYATQHGEVLYTVVGSCIAACIYDEKRKVAGINHFMLPGMVRPDEIRSSEVGRYGMFAMELLIGELIKLGAQRGNLRAKLFGGGNILNFRKSDGDVNVSNISFGRKFLELECIPTVREDLGGSTGRKILFFSDGYRVLLKRFDIKKDRRSFQEEENYKVRVFRERVAKSPVRLF